MYYYARIRTHLTHAFTISTVHTSRLFVYARSYSKKLIWNMKTTL